MTLTLNIISALYKSAEGTDTTPKNHTKASAEFLVDISTSYDDSSEPVGAALTDFRKEKNSRPTYNSSFCNRNGGVHPYLVNDKISICLGLEGDKKLSAKDSATHKAYLSLLQEYVAQHPEDAKTKVVFRYLTSETCKQLFDGVEKIKNSDKVLFYVDGEGVYEESHIIFWQSKCCSESTSENEEKIVCAISGKPGTPINKHPKIKGVSETNPEGAVLLSSDKTNYKCLSSDSKDFAPMTIETSYKITSFLNNLLASPNHKVNIAKTTYLIWSADPRKWDLDFFSNAEKGLDYLEVATGKTEIDELTSQESEVYVASFIGFKGRIAVESFCKTSHAELKENSLRFLNFQKNPLTSKPSPVWALAKATVPKGQKKHPYDDYIRKTLGDFVLHGKPLAEYFLQKTVNGLIRDRWGDLIISKHTDSQKYLRFLRYLQLIHLYMRSNNMDTESNDIYFNYGKIAAYLHFGQLVAQGKLTVPGAKSNVLNSLPKISDNPEEMQQFVMSYLTGHYPKLKDSYIHRINKPIHDSLAKCKGNAGKLSQPSLLDKTNFVIGFAWAWSDFWEKKESRESKEPETVESSDNEHQKAVA